MKARDDQDQSPEEDDQPVVQTPRDDRTDHVNSTSGRGAEGWRQRGDPFTPRSQSSIIIWRWKQQLIQPHYSNIDP